MISSSFTLIISTFIDSLSRARSKRHHSGDDVDFGEYGEMVDRRRFGLLLLLLISCASSSNGHCIHMFRTRNDNLFFRVAIRGTRMPRALIRGLVQVDRATNLRIVAVIRPSGFVLTML
ncbi:hypothetical protein C2E23DRAFT_531405 [Lenzites betulinus]|nr:hypothetical protein C2E23DRAFT_531405 [Lenzites betulinus]